jgi:hypothetical protein
MGQKASPLGAVVLVVAGVIGYCTAPQLKTFDVGSLQEAQKVEDSLTSVAEEFNKRLPMQVDGETRLDQIEIAPDRKVVYRYTLTNYAKVPDFNQEYFVSVLRPNALNTYKTNAGMKKFRDLGVSLHYNYFDRNGVYLTEMEIGPDDLK